jgi:hypothetical protein
MVFVYLGLIGGPLAGRILTGRRRSPGRFAIAVSSGALWFFLLSNLGNWLVFDPPTGRALLECYVRGLPLLGQALLGDALFTVVLFGADALVRRIASGGARVSAA